MAKPPCTGPLRFNANRKSFSLCPKSSASAESSSTYDHIAWFQDVCGCAVCCKEKSLADSIKEVPGRSSQSHGFKCFLPGADMQQHVLRFTSECPHGGITGFNGRPT